ncbi:hypothetical protein [Rhizobacter fulvus]
MESRILEARQGLVRPHRAVQVVIANPPPTPACWDGDKNWIDWLVLSYCAGLPIARRRDLGKYRGQREVKLVARLDVDYCAPCLPEFKTSMQQRGRCHPCAAERERELKQSRGPSSEPPATAVPAGGINHDESAETA